MIKRILLIIISSLVISSCGTTGSSRSENSVVNTGSLVAATPAVKEYAFGVVKPILDSYDKKDRLSQLLKVSEIINDPKIGIQTNSIKPGTFIIYDKLETLKLGFLYILNLSSYQKQIVKTWHSHFMRKNPADVFFAPSANDIIRTKAAFGCSHYARSFIAIVKALKLIGNPENLRYAITSKSDNYNQALALQDKEQTINGHQFVLVKIAAKWTAINTSKSESTSLPGGFNPGSVLPPKNISIQFASYPEVVFLFRKIGNDFYDDCGDNSLNALMNIYRSGEPANSEFLWERFEDK
jgi:hypothetical protein